MGVLGTENDELSGPDPDEKLRPVCKKPNVFFRIERPPGNTALPTLPPTHRFDYINPINNIFRPLTIRNPGSLCG